MNTGFNYPVGTPSYYSIYDEPIPDIESWINKVGMASVTIEAPTNDYYPILPVRIPLRPQKKPVQCSPAFRKEQKDKLLTKLAEKAGDEQYDYAAEYDDIIEPVRFQPVKRPKYEHQQEDENLLSFADEMSLLTDANSSDIIAYLEQKSTARKTAASTPLKVCFPLCYSCAYNGVHELRQCQHTDKQRQWTATYTIAELKEALKRNYRIKKVHQLFMYKESSNLLFSDYISYFYKVKLLATSFESEEEKLDAMALYNEIFPETKIKSTSEFSPNLARRTSAKLFLNS